MKITYLLVLVAVVVLGGLSFFAFGTKSNTSPDMAASDAFAQCLADAGAKFYGTFWCPHCQDQKTLLRHSAKLPYIECSTPDGQGQTPECIAAGIEGYPTWVFADGSRLTGLQTLETLGEKTGCALPSAPEPAP